MSVESFKINPIQHNCQKSNNLQGYFVQSTATTNVEDGDGISKKNEEIQSKNQQYIKKIVEHLVKADEPQLVINIHGYSTNEKAAKNRNEQIYNHAVENNFCQENSIFIGYRWPSENIAFSLPILQESLEALPSLLLGILITTLALIFIPVSLLFSKWTLLWALVSFTLSFLVWHLAKADGALPIFPNGISLVLFSSALFLVLKYPFSEIKSKLEAIAISDPSFNWLKNTINFLLNHSWGLLVILAILSLVMLGRTVVNNKPIFPNHLSFFVFCLAIFLFFAIAINWFDLSTIWMVVALFFGLVSLCSIVLALILLRKSNYPRDRFRAFNYGVMDLVEFIRQLEQGIKENPEKSDKPKIHLSFIAHSLGSEVVTQTIRILTNVFDRDRDDRYINDFFKLERLVLVAPDIPVESILSGRANFLQYSLSRVAEAYIFSNEADLALRMASTAANYFSFPSKSRFRGYKLGNITAKHFDGQNDKRNRRLKQLNDYGIVNLNSDRQNKEERFNAPLSFEEPIDYLEIRASNIEHRNLEELAESQLDSTKNIANHFTYFDCTDYQEKGKGVLSYALKKSALNIFDYLSLLLAKPLANIDGHGDYFKGEFSQKAIYGLAFFGFEKFIDKNYQENQPQKSLTKFANDCRDKYIQALLAEKLQKLFFS